MKRFRLGLVGLATLVGLLALALAGPASAFHTKNPSSPPGTGFTNTDYRGFDPMEASIPYLAWRGEEVRLVKCFTPTSRAEGALLAESDGEWQIIDWSGDAHVWPKFFDDVDQRTSSFAGQGDQAGRVCWAIDITSHKPGIAIVKLKVDADGPLVGGGDPVLVHQFNVIWMTLDRAILRNLSGGTGGPTGPITENPSQRNRLGVVVKGRVPLNEQFRTELGRQRAGLNADSIVLPDAWVDLANSSLASISRGLRLANNGILGDDPVNPAGPERALTAADFWDIHDSTGPFNTGVFGPDQPLTVADICPVPPTGVPANHLTCHVSQVTGAGVAACNGTAPLNDTVDNCTTGELSTFSRVFHDVSGPPTIGPYSPTRPDETMLSDSVLNAHDAPMPSAVVVANIAPNTGGTDIGGVGFFSAVDKHVVYNRGGAECPAGSQAPHCLTAPFYASYIPPSPTMESNPAELTAAVGGNDDRDTASGIHGAIANDFEGYLPVSYQGNPGLYHFWDIIEVRREAVATATRCPDPRNGFRPTPSGPQSVALYTDEHGEAQFQFNAGLGFFFNQFLRPNDPQAGCLPVGLIGTANISVDVLYPFQPVTHAGLTSNPILKRIESLFQKGIICVPKRFEEDDKVLCVVFGRDIDGSPIIGETVCVTAIGDSGTFVRTFIPEHQTSQPGSNTACGRLHANPDAREDLATDEFPTIDQTFGIETFLIIGQGRVRIIADFRDEQLEFGTTVQIPAPAGTPGGTTGASIGQVLGTAQQLTPVRAPVPVPGPGGVGVVPTNPTNSGNATPTGRTLGTPTLKAKASLVFVRIVKPMKQGAVRSVVLRVKSSKKTAQLQIKLIGKRGKVLGTMVRKVKTNRTVKVPNLRLPKAVVTVRVKVIA